MAEHVCFKKLLKDIGIKTTLFAYSSMNNHVEEFFEVAHMVSKQIIHLHPNDAITFHDEYVIEFAVFIIDDVEDLRRYFDVYYTSMNFNQHCKYIIMYTGDMDHIDDILEITWHTFSTNVIVLDEELNLYAPRTISANRCEVQQLLLLDECYKCHKKVIGKALNVEYNNWFGCKIKVLTFKLAPYVLDLHEGGQRGMEQWILEEVAKKLKFEIVYVQHEHTDWGTVYANGTITNMYQSLYEREADLMIGFFHAKGTALKFFDGSSPYFPSQYAFFLPKANRIPEWIAISRIFRPRVYLILFLSLITFALVVTFFQKISIISKVPRDVGTVKLLRRYANLNGGLFMNNFTVLVGLLMARSSKQPTGCLIRILFLTWVVFSHVFSSVFEAVLLSFLVRPAYENQINTLQEIVDNNLLIYGVETTKELFEMDNGNKYVKEIYDRWNEIKIGDAIKKLEAMYVERNAAVMTNARTVAHVMKLDQEKNIHENVDSVYKMDSATSKYAWILMQRGFPLKEAMDDYILDLRNAGFLEYLVDQSDYIRWKLPEETNYFALKIDNVSIAFIAYIFGVFVSFVVFTCEMVNGRSIFSKRKICK